MLRLRGSHACLLPAIVCVILWTTAPALRAQDDPRARLVELMLQLAQQMNSGDMPAAEATADRMLALVRNSLPGERGLQAAVMIHVANVKVAMGRYEQGEDICRSALAICESLPGQELGQSICHGKLGEIHLALGRLTQAERHLGRAYRIAQEKKLPEFPVLTDVTLSLADLYQAQTRYAESETWARYAISVLERHVAADAPEMQRALGTLAGALQGQRRFAETEHLRRQALRAVEQKFGKDHYQTVDALRHLGMFYLLQHRSAEAREHLSRALEISERHQPESLSTADLAFFLAALLLLEEQDVTAAERHFGKANRIAGRVLGPESPYATLASLFQGGGQLVRMLANPELQAEEAGERLVRTQEFLLKAHASEVQRHGADSPEVLPTLLMQVEWLLTVEKLSAALPPEQRSTASRDAVAALLAQVAALVERHPAHPTVRSSLAGYHELAARAAWLRGDREDAVANLRLTFDLLEAERGTLAGSEFDQARYFAETVRPFFHMISWQAELGPEADVAEAFRAAERARARSLLVQMELRGVDLLRRLPASEAAPLRTRLLEAQSRVRQAEYALTQSGASADAGVVTELREAREAYVDALRDVRNASPDYRLALRSNHQPIGWEDLRALLRARNALLLQYVATDWGVYLIAVDGEARSAVYDLRFTEAQARELGLSQQPFGEQLHYLLQGRGEGSLLARLRAPEVPDDTVAMLAALWRTLVPESEAAALRVGDYDLLIVAPDGELALLPFETLVVEAEGDPVYLLDIGPPVLYAPSATVLANLAARPAPRREPGVAPVLTVGDPSYGEPRPSSGLLASVTPRSTFRSIGGSLAPLPFSAEESGWVEQVFRDRGIAAERLQGRAATEAAIRSRTAQRAVVHLACHGFADQSHGNLFGALAVTPNPESTAPSDDGFLAMAELNELDLSGCELTILSACDTNVGPQQRGEGVWALSRACLVAGSRRVVASSWLVDDESAASLVSYFCAGVARDMSRGGPVEYAGRLHTAKRWIRSQEKWRSPYYWAAFVLMGVD